MRILAVLVDLQLLMGKNTRAVIEIDREFARGLLQSCAVCMSGNIIAGLAEVLSGIVRG